MSSVTTVNGAELWHEQAGSGPNLVLLHSSIADSRMWDGHFERYARSYRVLRYDRRGFGRSNLPGGPYSYVADHVSLMDALSIERAWLIGSSGGGMSGLDVAILHPDRVHGLVLIGAGLDDHDYSEEMKAADKREEELWEQGDGDAIAELDFNTWVVGPKRQADDMKSGLRERMFEMHQQAFNTQWAAYQQELAPGPKATLDPPAGKRLAEIKVPTLVMVGSHDVDDMLVCAERMEREIPSAQRYVMDGVAHFPNLERPEEFDRVVLDFLAENKGRNGT